MKYLVNTQTKEHIRYNDDKMSPVGIWKIVEADADGWIPWNGGECPLPDSVRCVVRDEHCETNGRASEVSWRHEEPQSRGAGFNITAYRPILAEKEEVKEFDIDDRSTYFVYSNNTVFARLRQATEAAESIPAILAEINALLPDGYCVEKKTAATGDMENHENWKEGDILECIRDDVAYCTKGNLYAIGHDGDGDYGIFDNDGDVLSTRYPGGEYYSSRFFRFHSLPVKS